MEYGEDHPVRKLISRFRKMSCTPRPSAINMTSPEPGHLDDEEADGARLLESPQPTSLANHSEAKQTNTNVLAGSQTNSSSIVSGVTGVSAVGGGSKWGRLRAGLISTDSNPSVAAAASPVPNDASTQGLVLEKLFLIFIYLFRSH